MSCLDSSHKHIRRVTRNILGQGSFLGIRVLQYMIIYNAKKKGPAGKNLRFFTLATLKNFPLNEKFHPKVSIIRAFFNKSSSPERF